MATLPSNHTIKLLLEYHYSNTLNLHHLFLEKLTSKQRLKVKSSIVNTNNHLNGIFPSFNPLHKELMPSFHLVNIFPNYFSFNIVDHKIKDFKDIYLWKLNNIFKDFLQDTKSIVIIFNASIKKQHCYIYSLCLIRTKHWH